MRLTTQTLPIGRRRAPLAGLAKMLALAGLLLVACQQQALPVAAAPANVDKETTILLSQIRAEIGLARCDSSTQCRTLGIGEKACGGPDAWLAWSTEVSDAAHLAALSAESAALARRRNAQSGMASNCRYNPDPGAQCDAGVCRLRSPNLAI